jgi:hypothetical protein
MIQKFIHKTPIHISLFLEIGGAAIIKNEKGKKKD